MIQIGVNMGKLGENVYGNVLQNKTEQVSPGATSPSKMELNNLEIFARSL